MFASIILNEHVTIQNAGKLRLSPSRFAHDQVPIMLQTSKSLIIISFGTYSFLHISPSDLITQLRVLQTYSNHNSHQDEPSTSRAESDRTRSVCNTYYVSVYQF